MRLSSQHLPYGAYSLFMSDLSCGQDPEAVDYDKIVMPRTRHIEHSRMCAVMFHFSKITLT